MHSTQNPSPADIGTRRICYGEDHGYCCPEGIYLPQPDGTAVHRDDLTAVTTTPADILRSAARYLQLHGWTQGNYYATGDELTFPPACAAGAIGMAAHGTVAYDLHDPDLPGHADFERAWNALDDYLFLANPPADNPSGNAPDDELSIIGWNDRDDRTVEQVIAALTDAADDWDRIHGGAR